MQTPFQRCAHWTWLTADKWLAGLMRTALVVCGAAPQDKKYRKTLTFELTGAL